MVCLSLSLSLCYPTLSEWNWNKQCRHIETRVAAFLAVSLSLCLSLSHSLSLPSVNALWPHLICTHLHFGALCKCRRAHFAATSRNRKVTPRCGHPLLSISLFLPLPLSIFLLLLKFDAKHQHSKKLGQDTTSGHPQPQLAHLLC